MKTIIVTLTLILFSFAMQEMHAQNDSIPNKTERLETLKQKIIDEEKEGLRNEIERIQLRLDKKSITQEEADKLKQEAAEKHALNIENKIAILENKMALDERNSNNYTSIELLGNGKIVNINVNYEDEKDRVYDRRTTSDLVLAAGFNNVISDENSLDNSDFKIGGSRFF